MGTWIYWNGIEAGMGTWIYWNGIETGIGKWIYWNGIEAGMGIWIYHTHGHTHRYGQFLGLLDTSPSHVPCLMEVLTTTRAMLATQQHDRRHTEFCKLRMCTLL